jgi:ribose transport system permease protein
MSSNPSTASVGTRLSAVLRDQHWIWAAGGALAVWVAMGLVTNGVHLESLASNAVSASFLVIAALGQMYVVTSGRGAIDLSIPGVITLGAFVATGFIHGSDARLLVGVPLLLAMGATIGAVNGAAVLFLRIPPIIATLAIGYVLTTAALLYNEGFAVFQVSPLLTSLARGRLLSVPSMVIFACAVAALAAVGLRRTVFGRSLVAIGQNLEAARLAGIRVNRVQFIAYMVSGSCAALTGALLSARVGGAFLGMGDSYLLESIGGVVIGGTLVFGGRSTALGTIFGCLFLVLLVTAMQAAGFPVGTQNIVKGALIVLVLIVATERPAGES